MLTATITLEPDGRLGDDATLTIQGETTLIPARHSGGGILAPRRILEAIDARGYRAVKFWDNMRDHDGFCTVVVAPKPATEE